MYDFEKMDKRYVIFGDIFMLANRLQTVMDKSNNDLTAKQWFVMVMLGMFEEPPTLKELAGQCGYSHQNTKQLVLKLEEKGFVVIKKDRYDMRAMRIITTERIRQWDEENKQFETQFVGAMFRGITNDEIKTMVSVQRKLYGNLGIMEGNQT